MLWIFLILRSLLQSEQLPFMDECVVRVIFERRFETFFCILEASRL